MQAIRMEGASRDKRVSIVWPDESNEITVEYTRGNGQGQGQGQGQEGDITLKAVNGTRLVRVHFPPGTEATLLSLREGTGAGAEPWAHIRLLDGTDSFVPEGVIEKVIR